MTLETWLLFCSASLLVILIPGPLSLLVVANSLNHGLIRSYPAFLGGVSASLILLVTSASGLGALLLASEQLFTLIRYCGALYLIWLGYQAWREAGKVVVNQKSSQPTGTGFLSLYGRAFTLGISNPKDILFFIAFLPQFIDPATALLPQLIVMSASWFALDLFSKLFYGGSARMLAPALKRGVNMKRFNRFSAGLFVSAGSAVLFK